MNEEFGIDAPRDPALRRALDNAPDRALEPRHDVRRAIHLAAYRAVEPEAETIDLDESIWRMWWRRLRGGGGRRRPWSAAFATLLIAGFVTLLWQREPVPDAKLDSETAAAPAAAPPPAQPATPSAPPPQEPPSQEPPSQESPMAAAPPVASPAPVSPATPGAAGEAAAPPALPPEPPSIVTPQASGPAPGAAAPPAGAVAPAARQEAPSSSLAKQGQSANRLPSDDLPADEVRESESKAKAAAALPPTPAAPPPAPAAPAPAPKQSAPPASPPPPAAAAPAPKQTPPPPPPTPVPALPPAPAAQAAPPGGGATDRRAAGRARDEAAAAPAPAPQRAAPPGTRTDATDPPTFAALSQWRRVTVLRTDGSSRNLSREEIPGLAPLLGSAALSAVTAQPLPDEVEYRVVLERANGDRLASLDIAGNWVRWREGRLPPGTGAPSAGALAALREALREALDR